jgi:hypothetical protein
MSAAKGLTGFCRLPGFAPPKRSRPDLTFGALAVTLSSVPRKSRGIVLSKLPGETPVGLEETHPRGRSFMSLRKRTQSDPTREERTSFVLTESRVKASTTTPAGCFSPRLPLESPTRAAGNANVVAAGFVVGNDAVKQSVTREAFDGFRVAGD